MQVSREHYGEILGGFNLNLGHWFKRTFHLRIFSSGGIELAILGKH